MSSPPSASPNINANDDDVHKIQENFCKNFTCCGQILDTLHDLLEHYELYHVHVPSSHSSSASTASTESQEEGVQASAFHFQHFPIATTSCSASPTSTSTGSAGSVGALKPTAGVDVSAYPYLPYTLPTAISAGSTTAGSLKRHKGDSFYLITPDHRSFNASSSSFHSSSGSQSSKPSSTASASEDDDDDRVEGERILEEENPMSAFDKTIVHSRSAMKRSHESMLDMSSFYGEQGLGGQGYFGDYPVHHHHHHHIINNSSSTSIPPLTVAPSCLTSSEDEEGLNSHVIAAAAASNDYRAYIDAAKTARRNMEYGASATGPGEERRKHQCLVPSCGKIYKNANGLKYHLQHTHSEEERDIAERIIDAIKNDPQERPYVCAEEGCGKRYKNANGLKYHMIHHHESHGQAGGSLN